MKNIKKPVSKFLLIIIFIKIKQVRSEIKRIFSLLIVIFFKKRIWYSLGIFILNIFYSMATRAKYSRVRQEEKKEEKPETDIIMKFSPTYGIIHLI